MLKNVFKYFIDAKRTLYITLMGLILAGIKFGEFGEFWQNSPN